MELSDVALEAVSFQVMRIPCHAVSFQIMRIPSFSLSTDSRFHINIYAVVILKSILRRPKRLHGW